MLLWAAVLAGLAVPALLVVCALFPPEIEAPTLAHFDRDQVEKARDYARSRYLLFAGGQTLVVLLLSAAVLLLFRQGWVPFPGANPYLQVAAFVVLLLVVIELVTLPLEYYCGFVLEHRFGLSTQSPAQWGRDQALGFAVQTVLALAVFLGFYFIIRHVPTFWPVVAAGAFGLFLVVQAVIAPVVIDPLFYRFQSLPEGPFREQVVALAYRAGIEVGEVLVADASRRTTKANAYFTGMGQTKRIVLYDNLLHRFSEREAALVMAHEIGHWQHRHITKGILLGMAGSLVFFLLYRVIVVAGYGVPAGHPATVPVLLLFLTVFSLLTLPVQNAVSRGFERQADRVSLELTGDADGAVVLYRNLARTNLADVQPHPVIWAFLFTHPPAVERIAAAERWAAEKTPPGPAPPAPPGPPTPPATESSKR